MNNQAWDGQMNSASAIGIVNLPAGWFQRQFILLAYRFCCSARADIHNQSTNLYTF
jgi:hypothetical protein